MSGKKSREVIPIVVLNWSSHTFILRKVAARRQEVPDYFVYFPNI